MKFNSIHLAVISFHFAVIFSLICIVHLSCCTYDANKDFQFNLKLSEFPIPKIGN